MSRQSIYEKYPFLQISRKTKVVGNHLDNKDYYHLCVTVSKDYLIKVLALYESLAEHSSRFKLWVCCMDKQSFMTFAKLKKKHMVLFFVEQLEDEVLREVRQKRQMNEYCWTIKAPLVHHLLTAYNLESVLYCDGDLFFFSDPKKIFDEWGSASVYLTPQRDRDWVEKKYGKYQAGLIGFRNDQNGLQCVKWWKKQCEEWCSSEADEDRFGDQKYLDSIPTLFSNIKISSHLGINAAPWNCVYNNEYHIEKRNEDVFIEDDQLINYHFACFSIFNESEFELWSLNYLKIKRPIKKYVYETYILKLREILQNLKNKRMDLDRFYSKNDMAMVKTYYKFTPLRRKMDETDDFYCFCTIVSKEYLIKGIALYQSLIKHGDAFHLWICCMDNDSQVALMKLNLKHATLIPFYKVENDSLNVSNNERTLVETCWTMKPLLCSYILEQYKEVDHLVYCDADMYFFSSVKPLFDLWSIYSVFLNKQRSTEEVERVHGKYQAGLIGFKQDPNSIKVLNWWKERCLEWCYDSSIDSTRWGDQKYLNQIPHLFSNIKTINHVGIDTAPWNLVMMGEQKVSKTSEHIMLDHTPLLCYHFGSLLMLNKDKFELWKIEELPFTQEVLDYIYAPYIENLRQIYHDLIMQQIIDNGSEYLSTVPANYTPKNLFLTGK